MRELSITDLASLRTYLEALDGDCLLRGQTTHYTAAGGAPNITTSFHRHGCIPPLMVKWHYYADEILRVLSSVPTLEQSPALSQAILQHYGWRSFFVDVTKRPAVAAWFASHRFRSKNRVELTETCDEEYAMLVHQVAHYEKHVGAGHLYVISKRLARDRGISFVDLEEELPCEDTTPRFHRQAAGLLGNLERVAPEVIVDHVTVPAAVLQALAESEGMSAAYLFPGRDEDFFLKLLLSVPWERAPGDVPIARRGLMLPEYDFVGVRIQPPQTAVYRQQWLAAATPAPFPNATVFEMHDVAFYGRPPNPVLRLPRVSALLRSIGLLVVETAGLIRHPEMHETTQYAKGLVLNPVGNDIVQVSELETYHPGSHVTGVRALAPWSYRMSGTGEWTRTSGPNDCPCHNHGRHERHGWSVLIFEDLLERGRFQSVRPGELREIGL